MKLLRLSVVAALLTALAFGDEEKSKIGLSANMALTSNYVWRGMTQTKDSPAVQGGVDLSYMGFYVGTWGSNVDFGVSDNNSLEMDIYGGYVGELAGIGYDVGYIQYVYPNKSDEYNFGEAYIGVSKELDKFGLSAKYSFGIETDDINPEDFWEIGASTSVLPYEIGFDAGYGNYDNIGQYYSVALSREFEKLALSIAYIDFDHDTDSSADEENVIATISFSF